MTPTRSDADVEIDRLFRHMVNAEDAESKVRWGRRYTDAIRERNAQRSPQEIEQLERERGLR